MGKYLDSTGLTYLWSKLKDYFQAKLVSGTNIKTINGNSLLGSGNIDISGGGSTDVIVLGENTAISTLSTSVTKVSMSTTTFNEGSGFSRTNGGIECLKSGIIHVVGKVRFSDGFTANDYLVAKLTNGNTEIAQGRTRIPFTVANSDVWVEAYTEVSANDYIYLQALNASGARGKVPASLSSLSAAYVTTGSGGGSDYVISQEVIDAFQMFLPQDIQQEPGVADVIDGTVTSLDDLAVVFTYIMGDIYSRL